MMRVLCVTTGQSPIPLEQFIDQDDEILDASMYMRQIQQYLSHYDRDQLLLLTVDELKSDPAGVLENVQRHIGVSVHDLTGEQTIVANSDEKEVIAEWAAWRWLRQIQRSRFGGTFSKAIPKPWRGKARSLFVTCAARSPFGQRRKNAYVVEPMSADTRNQLLEMYEQPTKELEKFLGRDLSAWRR